MNKDKSSILLIYTGGTIGMKEDPAIQALKPFNFSQILEEVPELGKFAYRIDSHTFDPLIDSSDVEPSMWLALAGLIEKRYDDYDGFVILHGTDTMAYSASALSFMLEGLTKPVIFTGSQLPIGTPRTDGKENLISSVEIAAAKDEDGHALVPEVCIYFDNVLMLRFKNHVHFVSPVSSSEIIIISRAQRNVLVYFTSFSYLFLILVGILMIFSRSRKQKVFKSNYYRTRINTILLTSSILILVSMAAVSILFVYKRNEVNMRNLMSSKISTVQALAESRARNFRSFHDLTTQEFGIVMENISNTTKSDITFYTPEGKVFRSTTPEVFEKLILGSRIDQEAYHNICKLNQRFYIHREKIADYSYWALYAPIFNDNQDLLAIVCVPYTTENYDFRREAFFHASLIISLFILLLIASLIFSTREVDSMFEPLIEMGKKMNRADIQHLEQIEYDRDDEISSLVDAYNRMVVDLSDSTQKLALAERDKAWSLLVSTL